MEKNHEAFDEPKRPTRTHSIHRPAIHQASKADKKSILDELVAATGYHRKSATRLLNNQPAKQSPKTPRRRKRRYDDQVSIALVILWEAADRICSKRLAPFLPELLDALDQPSHRRSIASPGTDYHDAVGGRRIDRHHAGHGRRVERWDVDG